jgi:hypothetical protein
MGDAVETAYDVALGVAITYAAMTDTQAYDCATAIATGDREAKRVQLCRLDPVQRRRVLAALIGQDAAKFASVMADIDHHH